LSRRNEAVCRHNPDGGGEHKEKMSVIAVFAKMLHSKEELALAFRRNERQGGRIA